MDQEEETTPTAPENLKTIFKEAVECARRKASGQRDVAFDKLTMIVTAFAETAAEAYRLPYCVEADGPANTVEVMFGAWGCGRRTWAVEFCDDFTVFMADSTLEDFEGSIEDFPQFLADLLADEDSHKLFERCRELWEQHPELHAMNLEKLIGTWV